MGQLKTVKGDLLALALDGKFDVIVQGCNCHCRMKRGIALSISTLFPEAVAADQLTIQGDRLKLGTYSFAEIVRGGVKFILINAYTQYDWDGDGVNADYDAIRQVFEKIKKAFSGKRIAYPKIGAGLAGGDWNIIANILTETLAGEDHTYVEFVV